MAIAAVFVNLFAGPQQTVFLINPDFIVNLFTRKCYVIGRRQAENERRREDGSELIPCTGDRKVGHNNTVLRHARAGWMAEDQGSVNGTLLRRKVNGSYVDLRLTPYIDVPLLPYDQLIIGKSLVVFLEEAPIVSEIDRERLNDIFEHIGQVGRPSGPAEQEGTSPISSDFGTPEEYV